LKRPLGISFISWFYMFGACVLFITVVMNHTEADQFGIADRFGLPAVPEPLMRIIAAVITFIIIFGYYGLRRWGFWLMIAYSVGFGAVSIKLLLSYNQQPFIGNVIWSMVVFIYTLMVRKSFFNTHQTSRNKGARQLY